MSDKKRADRAEAKLRELVEAASAVDLFFQSGNDIPVERATIPADVWGPVQAALKAAKKEVQ